MEDNEETREKIEEIKRRLKEIERKTGKKIDLNKILRALFTKENLKKGTLKFLKIADKMLKEDINDYVEVGSQEKGPVKIEHGFRMRFLDDDKKEDNSSKRFFKIHFPKKLKEKIKTKKSKRR